jgi:restriction system protein
MAIPDYQKIKLPLLKFMSDGKEYKFSEMVEALAATFQLTEDERKELLPSGQQPVFDNRVGWARTYLKKACLIETKRRGFSNITERGKQVLSQNLTAIDNKFLMQFPEFVEFKNAKKDGKQEIVEDSETDTITPEEALGKAHQELRSTLSSELLQTVKNCSPSFFERLVIDVLIKMGYGGSRVEAGQAVGRSGDGGIDGIIKEDKLGLDIIYIQAKRWEGTVSRPEIQKFAGALQGQRARKGIFITTSAFTSDAINFAKSIDSKIILIDGQTLASLMIDHNVGVSPTASYEIKKIDSDYFSED